MFSLIRVLPKGIARAALGAALVITSITAIGPTAQAAPLARQANQARPLVYVGVTDVPHSRYETTTDLYGSITISGNASKATSTVFSASKYHSVRLRYDELPFTPNGVQDVGTTITVDLWDHWDPIWIPDTHLAHGTIDTTNAPYGFNTARVKGDNGRYVDIHYVKLARWSRIGLYGVNLTKSDDNPAQIYGSINGDIKQTIGGGGCISPYSLFDRTASDASDVWHGSPIWSATPPDFFYLYPDQGNKVRVFVDIWDYNYVFSNAHIAQGSVTIPITTSTTPVESSSEIPGPDGSVTVYWQSVLQSESD